MFEASQWIWHERLNGENVICHFRTRFEAGKGAAASLAASAQHVFRAYINGREISGLSSPAPSVFPRRMRFLEYEISPFLQEGENILAFTVLYLGGEGQNRMGGIPCLIFDCTLQEADGRIRHIVSDESCRCSDRTGYRQHLPFREARRLSASTCFDPLEEQAGWQLPGFSDTHWKRAVISPAQLLSPCLIRQEIPEGAAKYHWKPSLLARREGSAVYDAGEILTGYVRLLCEGKKGTVITLRYAELLEGERKTHERPEPEGELSLSPEYAAANDRTKNYLDQFVLTGNGRECWEEHFTYKAFRYFELSGLWNVRVHEIEVIKTGTALSPAGEFFCDSPLINQLAQACIRTQENALLGGLVDCPHREQAQYLGDSLLQSYTLLYNFTGGYSMLCKVLQDFSDAQTPDGQFPWVCPCDCTPGGPFSLRMPEYDLLFAELLFRAYGWSGDHALLRRFYPAALRMAVHYLAQKNEQGLLPKNQLQAMHISDWPYPSVDESEEVLFVENLYLLRALRRLEMMARQLEYKADAAFWEKNAAALQQALRESFYDADAVLFKDAPHSAHHHPGVNALAYMQGLFLPDAAARAREKIAALPFETSIILSFDYLCFLFENGFLQQAFDLIASPQARWGRMIAAGSRTIWEGFEDIESHSHAWSCYPLYLLQRYLLGICPAAPGGACCRVSPFLPAQLREMRGSVQTPLGRLSVCCERDLQQVRFSVDIPEGLQVEFQYEAVRERWNGGQHRITV